MRGELTLGGAIRELRKVSGIKQRDLAVTLDVSPTYLSHLEADRREPSLRLLRELSMALGAPPGLFLALALWADMPDADRAPYQPIFASLLQLAAGSRVAAPEPEEQE